MARKKRFEPTTESTGYSDALEAFGRENVQGCTEAERICYLLGYMTALSDQRETQRAGEV